MISKIAYCCQIVLCVLLIKTKRIEFFLVVLRKNWQSAYETVSLNASVCQFLRYGTVFASWLSFIQVNKTNKDINVKNIRTMNIKPLADRVLILPAPAEEKTIGGIIIPDTAKEKPLQGEVVAVGNGTKDEEMILKVGDTVLYGKYSGTEIEHEGVKYLMMRQSDVLAVLG